MATVINPSVIKAEITGQVVLLNKDTGIYFSLDEVGSHIWNLLEQGRDLQQISIELHAEYNADLGQLSNDVNVFISDLSSKGLLMA